jgi:hypothetical protein
MKTEAIPATPLNQEALWKVFHQVSGDVHLTTLLGAVIYAGSFGLRETEVGTHFHLECPNSKTAQELIGRATFLFKKLHEVFPITRLLISTVNDPFLTVPFDSWINLGAYEIPPDLLLGIGIVKNHPDWHAVIKLDEDGLIVR